MAPLPRIPRLRLTRADMIFAPVVVGSRLLANLVEGDTVPPQFADLLGGGLHKTDEPPTLFVPLAAII